MAFGAWRNDRTGRVWALRPGDEPPVSSLAQAFEGQDTAASDAIVLRGYLGRSDRIQSVREYLQRALRTAQGNAEAAATTSLTNSAQDGAGPNWVNTRNAARNAADEASARAMGFTGAQAQQLVGVIQAAPDPATVARINAVNAAAAGIPNDPNLVAVLELAAAVIEAQDTARRVENFLRPSVGLDRATNLARTLTDAAVLELLIAALDGVTEIAQPHLPWRLYLSPRLDRYVYFHPSSLIAWRREPKAERQDACTVWLRIFEKGTSVPIIYRVVSENTLGPSFATWLNGQLVDDYVDESSDGAWGIQAGGLTSYRTTVKGCIG